MNVASLRDNSQNHGDEGDTSHSFQLPAERTEQAANVAMWNCTSYMSDNAS